MKKKTVVSKRTSLTKAKRGDVKTLVAEVRNLIQSARHAAASVVNTLQVGTNFEIGRRIFEHEQGGKKRANYGELALSELALALTAEFGKGFSATNLKLMRQFYGIYSHRIGQTLSGQSQQVDILHTRSAKSQKSDIPQTPSAKLAARKKSQTLSDQFAIPQTLSGEFTNPFTLSWSHYVLLIGIKDPNERSFYEIEATNEGWSLSELKRQKDSCLYERLALSRDKKGVRQLAEKGQIITRPQDILKEPLVLEFLGLDEKAGYSESDLESALISHLEKFLLELASPRWLPIHLEHAGVPPPLVR